MRSAGSIASDHRHLDLDVAARAAGVAEVHRAAELRGARRDRPRRRRARPEADAVVVDRDGEPARLAARREGGRARARVAGDVARALEHDLERVLDDAERALEARPHRVARPLLDADRVVAALEVDKRADVGAERVVLAVDARLELRQLGERVLLAVAPQELA